MFKKSNNMEDTFSAKRSRFSFFDNAAALFEQPSVEEAMEDEYLKQFMAARRGASDDIAFRKFDRNFNGFIEANEFRKLMTAMKIFLPRDKLDLYFKMCDTKMKGKLDKRSFRRAFFGAVEDGLHEMQRIVGFCPGKFLTPSQALQIFDSSKEGRIGDKDFGTAASFIGLPVKDSMLQKAFKLFDTKKVGYLDKETFQEFWKDMSDARNEIEKRKINLKANANSFTLMEKLNKAQMVEKLALQELMKERAGLETWQALMTRIKQLSTLATLHSELSLSNAIDACGQVYVFGTGTNNQFGGKTLEKNLPNFAEFEKVHTLWQHRVNPMMLCKNKGDPEVDSSDSDEAAPESPKVDPIESPKKEIQIWKKPRYKRPPYEVNQATVESEIKAQFQMSEATNGNVFEGLVVADNTSWLWGRRVEKVSCGYKVAYAKTEDGQLYAWGGNPIPTNDGTSPIRKKKVSTKQTLRGKQQYLREDKPLTPRSEAMKATAIVPRTSEFMSKGKRMLLKVLSQLKPPVRGMPAPDNEELVFSLEYIAQYYDIQYERPSNSKKSVDLRYLKRIVLGSLTVQKLEQSLQLRGILVKSKKKLPLLLELVEAISLELERHGIPFHHKMKNIEEKIRALESEGSFNSAKELRLEGHHLWKELRTAKQQLAEGYENNYKNTMDEYTEIVDLALQERNRYEAKALEESTKNSKENFSFNVLGLTSRGSALHTYRGNSGMQDIAVGAEHIVAVNQLGNLYSWGVGISGRLGVGTHKVDFGTPQLVASVKKIRFKQVSTGFSHSAALSTKGAIYIWGSASSGKLGAFDSTTDDFHCNKPVILSMPCSERIKFVSCGSGHTAAVSIEGHLYTWGCSDGGRLGLTTPAKNNKLVRKPQELSGFVSKPTLVMSLLNVKIAMVSCGVSHTAIVTIYDGNTQTGGLLYVCGSAHALGEYTPNFKVEKCLQDKNVVTASCGVTHTACCTLDGELFTWGMNKNACTGHPAVIRRVQFPTAVRCMYRSPANLAVGMKAIQSTTSKSCHASLAVNGNFNGTDVKLCAITSLEDRPYWQVDLGKVCQITKIRVWNCLGGEVALGQDADEVAKRLFPLAIIIGVDLFPEGAGKYGFRSTLRHYPVHKRLEYAKANPIVWTLDEAAHGRYVRLQVDSTTVLSVAEVEVFGTATSQRLYAKASSVSCAENVTMAIVSPERDSRRLEALYYRAIYADRRNELILRQYATYHPYWLKYKDMKDLGKCPACQLFHTCDRCQLLNECTLEEVPKRDRGNLTLDDIITTLQRRVPKGVDKPEPVSKNAKLANRFKRISLPAKAKASTPPESESDESVSSEELE